MSDNAATTVETTAIAPTDIRARYVRPAVEPLGSWSALTMQLSGGGGFIDLSSLKSIADDAR